MSGISFKYQTERPDAEFPFLLTTGRCIWHWHTGTMTRRSENLEREEPTRWVEINDEGAKVLGIKNGEMVKAISCRGEIQITARVTDTIKKGVMFILFNFVECVANMLTINALDPNAKIPKSKACAVKN
jgi:formate dehydrogenase (coenzyme F420) alpha subunit